MPHRSKVKRRFRLFAALGAAISSACLATAETGDKAPSIGELAVSTPRPPVLVPPLLEKASAKSLSVKVNLKTQRLQLLVDGEVALDTPVTTGRKNMETPVGKFLVAKKEPARKQDRYGNLVDSRGSLIVSGVYKNRDPLPSGLRFQATPLKHVITIEKQGFILHGGTVGTLPVSEGSVIVPAEIAKTLYAKIAPGCPIEVVGE